MNYYIKGDTAKADKIKAAFEKLGYDISWPEGCANPDVVNIGVERNGAKYVVAETSEYIRGIIKTHPDYKELELPVEPKYKVHDCVVSNGQPAIIHELKKDYYLGKYLNGHDFCHKYADEDKLHLWSIEDAEDGDVLCTYEDNKPKIVFIYKDGDRVLLYHCFHNMLYNLQQFVTDVQPGCLAPNGNVKPATKEQRDLLFKKMKEAGYTWDADKKELRKIQHYDIANFHAGMPVLVRETSLNAWQYVLFSHCYIGGDGLTRFNAGLVGFTQCIPYNDDTKHLLGTTDMCSEEYINW